jgi:hypothetical protein
MAKLFACFTDVAREALQWQAGQPAISALQRPTLDGALGDGISALTNGTAEESRTKTTSDDANYVLKTQLACSACCITFRRKRQAAMQRTQDASAGKGAGKGTNGEYD